MYVCAFVVWGVEMDSRELLHKSQILINCDRWFKDTENYVKLKIVIDIGYHTNLYFELVLVVVDLDSFRT